MSTVQPMRDASDLRLGERPLQEIEFAAAGMGVALGDRQHRAVVLGDHECAVLFFAKIGEIAIVIEDLGNDPDLPRKGLLRGPRQRLVQTPLATPGEDPLDHRGILVLDIGEQFVRERAVVPREERITGGSQVVIVARPTGSDALDFVGDQPIRFERSKMLARATARDLGLFGEALSVRHTIPLEDLQHQTAGLRQCPDRNFLTRALGAFGIERDIGNVFGGNDGRR